MKKLTAVQDEKQSIKKFFYFFDFIPVIKKEQNLDIFERLFHTLVGCSIMLVAQLVPFFGIHQIAEKQFSLLTGIYHNFTTISRNTMVIAPILSTVILKNILNETNLPKKQKDSFQRGARHISVLISCFIRLPLAFYYLKYQNNIFLTFPKDYFTYILVCHVFQSYLVTIMMLWIEEYLNAYGIGGNLILFYYQLADTCLDIFNNPIPVIFDRYGLLNIIVLILALILIDEYLKYDLDLSHVRDANIKRKMTLNLSSLFSSAHLIYDIVKTILHNFILHFLVPLINLINKYTTLKLKNLPASITENIFFNSQFAFIYYLKHFDAQTLYFLAILLFDTIIFYGSILYFIDFFDSEFEVNHLNQMLNTSNFVIRSSENQYLVLSKTLKEFKKWGTLVGVVLYLFANYFPFYGLILRGVLIIYFFGRFKTILEMIKQQKDLIKILSLTDIVKKI